MQTANKDELIAQLIKQHLSSTPNGTVLSVLRGIQELSGAKATPITRADVNRVLYHNNSFEASPGPFGTAPLWKLKPVAALPLLPDHEYILVAVDLGNVHDAIQPLHVLVEDGQVDEVWAFADKAFNGPGVNPPPRISEVKVFVAPDGHRNSADVLMIWRLKELVDSRNGQRTRIVIITKDQGFLTLKTLIDQVPRASCDICTSWSEAKLCLLGK